MMSDNGPPFDDDDLINEYFEEESFPAEYDDEYMEEFAGDGNEGEGIPPIVDAQNEVTSAGKEKVVGTDLEGVADDEVNRVVSPIEDGSEDIPVQMVSVPLVSKKTNKDPYSFERYNGGREWRQKSAIDKRVEGNVMAAAQWKEKMTDKSKEASEAQNRGSSRSQTITPDAQLVQFSSDRISEHTSYTTSPRFVIQATLPVENEESIEVTLSCGKMLHVRKCPKEFQYIRSNHNVNSEKGTCEESLLGISIGELMRRAEVIEKKNGRKKRLKPSYTETADIDSEDVMDEPMVEEEVNCVNNSKRVIHDKEKLWVDKHAPSHFSDLLSDERINREVLRALRQWDPYVFGKEPPPRPSAFEGRLNEQKLAEKISNDEEGKKDTRPDDQNRVILLSGPPGVGKTTLAHIVAKHAGYRPMEVNASDERSAKILTERVTRAMESSTLNVKSRSGKVDEMAGRPNCLILDEIDGADAKSAIAALVNIIKAEKNAGNDSKRKSRKTFLRRPIIFICNHKHAPALKPLLPYSRQFDVVPPSANRLVSRLKSVLAVENMSLVGGSSMLHQLIVGAGGDIRSSLYTLQFAAARAREIAYRKRRNDSIVDIENMVVDISSTLSTAFGGNGRGLKDERSNMTSTLSCIFRKVKSRSLSRTSPRHRDVERVLETIERYGDNSRALDLLFLNIVKVSYVDPTLDKCWTAHDWLSSVDVYRSMKTSIASNNSSEHYAMQKCHIPSAAAAVHLLCRVQTRPDLTYSLRQLMDTIYQLDANNGLVDKFLEGLHPSARSGVQKSNFISDILPYCLWLLSAGVGKGSLTRSVSSIDFLTKEEKAFFNAHVDVLRNLGLTYVKVDGEEDNVEPSTVDLRLEPEIDKLLKYQGMKSMRGHVPPTLKELLAHAANVASLKEHEGLHEKKHLESNEPVLETKTSVPKKPKFIAKEDSPKMKLDGKKKRKAFNNFLGIGAAKAKAAKTARKAAQVGFERSKSKVKLSNTGSGVPLDQVVRFKYQKGFTQAVRLPCNANDLLL